MPYTSLEKIKRRLNITTTDQDQLLTDILNEVDAEINVILSLYAQTPVTNPKWTPILDGIEADWVAGRYRMLVEPNLLVTPEGEMREHALVTDAKRRLRTLIENMKGGVVGKI